MNKETKTLAQKLDELSENQLRFVIMSLPAAGYVGYGIVETAIDIAEKFAKREEI